MENQEHPKKKNIFFNDDVVIKSVYLASKEAAKNFYIHRIVSNLIILFFDYSPYQVNSSKQLI